MTKAERIVSIIYTLQTQYELVKSGHQEYDEGRGIILKWMNFGLPEGQYHDLMEYFQEGIANHSDIMKNPKLLSESKRLAWDALDYFDLIEEGWKKTK